MDKSIVKIIIIVDLINRGVAAKDRWGQLGLLNQEYLLHNENILTFFMKANTLLLFDYL